MAISTRKTVNTMKLAALAVILGFLAACDGVTVVSPRPGPVVAVGVPDGCLLVRSPARRARVITRLRPGFRGPRRGGVRISLEEHLLTHRYDIYDCGTVWRVVFIASSPAVSPSYVILRKDGVIVRQVF